MYRVILPLLAGFAVSTIFTQPAMAVEVYLFKGAGDFSFVNKNMHFSRGLQRIAKTLNNEGIHAEVRRFGATGDVLATIRRRKPESVAFIGHSMGALASLSMARQMRQEGIRVAYIGLIDIPGPVGTAGDNVEWAENYYSIFPVYARLTNADTHPNAHNIHVFGQIHTTMDDSKKVRIGMLAALRTIQAKEQHGAPEAEARMVENTDPQPQQMVKDRTSLMAAIRPSGEISPQSEDQQLAYEQTTSLQPIQLPSIKPSVGLVAQPAPQPVTSSAEQTVAQAQPATPLIDHVTTASVAAKNVMNTGRSLIGKARNFLARLNDGRVQRARSYER